MRNRKYLAVGQKHFRVSLRVKHSLQNQTNSEHSTYKHNNHTHLSGEVRTMHFTTIRNEILRLGPGFQCQKLKTQQSQHNKPQQQTTNNTTNKRTKSPLAQTLYPPLIIVCGSSFTVNMRSKPRKMGGCVCTKQDK